MTQTTAEKSLYQIGRELKELYQRRLRAPDADNLIDEQIQGYEWQIESIRNVLRYMPVNIARNIESASTQEDKEHQRLNGEVAIQAERDRIDECGVKIGRLIGERCHYKNATEDAEEYFVENEAQIYELAVLEAHIAGKTPVLDEPILVGILTPDS